MPDDTLGFGTDWGVSWCVDYLVFRRSVDYPFAMHIWVEWTCNRFGWDSRRDHDNRLVVGFVPILKDYGIFGGLIVFQNGFRSRKQYQLNIPF